MLPTDPALAILGDQATVAELQRVRDELRLDAPIPVQFWMYLKQLASGDLGTSTVTARPVLHDIAERFPATVELAALGALLGIAAGVPLGVLAAARRGKWIDQVIRIVSVMGFSVPKFWLALMALFVFYVLLDVAPPPGRIGLAYVDRIPHRTGLLLLDSAFLGDWEVFRSALAHAITPVLIFAFISMAPITRMTRSFMIEQLQEEYIVTARVKGLSERQVVWKHAFPAILVPLFNVCALTVGVMLEGSVLIESIFAWPGLGKYLVDSLFAADLNGVLGATLVIGIVFISLNLAADLLGRLVDPRTRPR